MKSQTREEVHDLLHACSPLLPASATKPEEHTASLTLDYMGFLDHSRALRAVLVSSELSSSHRFRWRLRGNGSYRGCCENQRRTSSPQRDCL